jgi:hypothetical protein
MKTLEYWQQNKKTIPLEKTEENFNICWICGKQFKRKQGTTRHCTETHKIDGEEYYIKFFKKENEDMCKVCGKKTKYFFGKYLDFCSYTCSNRCVDTNIKRAQAIKKAWKTVDINERQIKTNQTILNHFGDFETYHKNRIRKSEITCLKKYGTKSYIQSEFGKNDFKDKIRNKYGVENVSQLENIKKLKKKRINENTYENMKRFQNVTKPLFTIEEYNGNNQTDIYDWLCCKCNTPFKDYYDNGKIPKCLKCYPRIRSNIEREFKEILDINYIRHISNCRSVLDNHNELDFYCEDKKIAIEINGLYWHGELSGGKDKNYHLQKTVECYKKNIQLIHIFEDELYNKILIVKQRLKHIFGLVMRNIYARKCIIKEIDDKIKNGFLDKYHLQGKDKCNINLGLFYKNRLVAVMTFSKLRKALGQIHKEGFWELSRFATIANFNIIGGASKLLTYFEKTYNPIQIITYADRRWSQGNMYYKLGFKLDHMSPPSYWYMYNHTIKRIHRFNFRKNVLKDKLKIFDPNLSEWENMKNNGYDRIWDCGNLVFIKEY